jgi:hypothetical protein
VSGEHYRDAKATGHEAECLREARLRVEASASILAAAALGHVCTGDLADALLPIVRVLDDAARYIEQAGGE